MGMIRCLLLAAASVAVAEDPLAQWLDSLKFSLEDVTTEKAGITFKVTQLVCQNLQLAEVQSAVQDVGLSVTLKGVGITCTGHFAYKGLAIISGSGNLTATVASSADSTATVALQGTSFDKNLPWAVEATACSASINFKLTLKGSIVYDIINLFSTPISALIKSQAVKQACAQLKAQASGELSKKLAAFNHLFLPSATTMLMATRTAQAENKEPEPKEFLHVDVETHVNDVNQLFAPPEEEVIATNNLRVAEARRLQVDLGTSGGTVDWTRDESLTWISWLVDDVLGPERLDEALTWAFKGAHSVVIPGPVKPLMTTTVKQPDAGIELKVTAYLNSATVEGMDGMNSFSPVKALNPNDLSFKVGWGAAFGLGVDVKVQMEAVDLASGQTQASVEQEMILHLALQQPSLAVSSEVQVLSAEWPGKRTLAQMAIAPKECFTSVLKQPPTLKSLQVKFQGLAAPLSFVAKTQGALEASLASLLNNAVGLFNKVYEPLLPGTIERFASSDNLRQTLNQALEQKLQPGECLDPALASQQVRNKFPQFYGNWPPVLGGVFRSYIDNFVDGLLAHNTTILQDGLANMPTLPIPLGAKLTLRQLVFTGLNQVDALRVLLPSTENPSWLGTKASAKCPTPQAPWRPAFAVNSSLKAGNFAGDGLVTLEMPCGTLDAEVDVVVDLWHLMDVTLPPSLTCAMMSPLAKFDIKTVKATWGSAGRLIVKPKDGPEQYPLAQLCALHPRACEMADQIREYISSTEGATRLYHLARDAVLQKCTDTKPKLSAIAAEDTTFKTDQLGYTYIPADTMMLWVVSLLVILGLSGTYTFCATLGRLLRDEDCSPDLSHRSRLPLATICWYGARDPAASLFPKISTMVCSTLLAAGLVARILACFWLPFAAAGVSLEQHTGGTIFKDDTLLQYTFFGIGKQFGLGGSLYCQLLWFFMSLASALLCHVIMLMVWLTPFLAKYRQSLLVAGLVLGRFALSEAETTGNTAMVLGGDVPMPLGMVQKLGLGLEAGAYTSWFASFCTVSANLLLLKILPRRESPPLPWATGKAPLQVTLLQAVNSVLMLVGIALWYFCDFMHAETGGLAGAILDPHSFSASQLGSTDPSLRMFVILTAGLCPLLQMSAFLVGLWGKAPHVAKGMSAAAASFCLLDLFAIGYLVTFLEGVNGFASSAVSDFVELFRTVNIALMSNWRAVPRVSERSSWARGPRRCMCNAMT
ncbi:unnamed protein product [Effrenium voratum]|nr:unnamed protein product [Effrenium voratum]